ncbi:MAG: hypothetical protein M1818_008446 [Claussenomyces sp. TS43310]|nr:MAG: hypothetical protein M1818_008446 [Claussenomyces sp. TS43310]
MDLKCHVGLHGLPVEVYLKIVEHIFIARDVAVLSMSCTRFNLLNNEHGWRVFVQTVFPSLIPSSGAASLAVPPSWRVWAHSLTEQSASWDRRAINAVVVSVEEAAVSPHDTLLRWNGPTKTATPFGLTAQTHLADPPLHGVRQSTAVMPILSSMIEDASRRSNRTMMVCGAGSDLYLRVSGPRDHRRHLVKSNLVVRHSDFRPGKHDITSVNVTMPCAADDHVNQSEALDVFAGRSSGHLHRFRVSEGQASVVLNTFHTSRNTQSLPRHSVRSADTNGSKPSLLAACSDRVLSLYSTNALEEHDVWPASELEIEPERPSIRAWTTKFTGTKTLAVGLGGSSHPLALYHARATGLTLQASFSAYKSNKSKPEYKDGKSSIIYAVEPIPPLSNAGGSFNGDTLLSGWYDGVCRLYDIRACVTPVMTYYDPVDVGSAVYSLAAFGHERFLVGSASSKLKIFDFRLGAKAYFYTDALPCSPKHPFPKPDIGTAWMQPNSPAAHRSSCSPNELTGKVNYCTFHGESRADFYRPNTNIFLNPVDFKRPSPRARTDEQPIYSISRPSATCPIVYASTKGTVYELLVASDYTLKTPISLRMYETDDGIQSRGEPSEILPKLRKQSGGRRSPLMPRDSSVAASRLDITWHS